MTSSNGNIFHVTGPLWGNPPITGGFPSQRPVARSFDGFFDMRLKQTTEKTVLETPGRSLWRYCNGNICRGCLIVSESILRYMGNESTWLGLTNKVKHSKKVHKLFYTHTNLTFLMKDQIEKKKIFRQTAVLTVSGKWPVDSCPVRS